MKNMKKTMMIGLAAALLIAPGGATEPAHAATQTQPQTQAEREQAALLQRLRAEAEKALVASKALDTRALVEAEIVARTQAAHEQAVREQATRTEAERAQAERAQAEREQAVRAQQGLASQARMTNVRLELAITDQSGTGAPVRKKISLLLAERGSGRVRSSGTVFRLATPDDRRSDFMVELNVDAQVQAIVGNRVRVGITVEYAPGADGGPATRITADENSVTVSQRGSPLNQSVEVILVDGEATTIVEAADPASDRKVTLQATATIVR